MCASVAQVSCIAFFYYYKKLRMHVMDWHASTCKLRSDCNPVPHGDAGPTQKPQINAVGNPKQFFGITEFGFSKKNEVVSQICMC